MITFTPMTTVAEIAEIVEAHQTRDADVYVRIESINGLPCAQLIREPHIQPRSLFSPLRRRNEG